MANETTASSTKGREPRAAGPVDRAFALLKIVVASPQPIGVRELARRAGLAPSTTARTLGILDDLGMVERTPEGAARPGAGLVTLTHRTEQTPASLRNRLRPLTADLMREFGENAAIAVDEGNTVLYVVSSRVRGALQVPDPTDDSFAFHIVAPGLIAMASWTEERLEAYLGEQLTAPTAFSVVNPRKIRARVRRAHRDHHAWTDQELDVDVNGVAVPIVDDTGDLIAMASLYGPAHRLNPTERPDLGTQLHTFVTEWSAELAWD